MAKKETFSSRWGIIFAALGMAIGAGNLWRFPRLAGQYGGTFLLLWVVFLLVWSIPILLAEFSIGKKYKKSVIGSFGSAVGPRFAWMGFFIAVCTLGITFYYSVVTGWGMRYFGLALQDVWANFAGGETLSAQLQADPAHLEAYWKRISTHNPITVVLHVVAVFVGASVLYRGVQKGFEQANRILIPILFGLLVIISAIALNMGNGIKGLEYMFAIKPELFGDAKVWIEALSQSAWSTGAGWGLMMTISSYSRKKEDVTLNIFISGFGNNTASLLAGVAILPAVFALAATEADAISFLQSGNQALTFTVIPKLFADIPGGSLLAATFFGAFMLAAFSSLLALIELFIRIIGDLGFNRHHATIRAALFCVLFGLPSAWSLDFFSNQDWVWGIGLVISGLFILFAVVKDGILKFKHTFIDKDSDFKAPDWYFQACIMLNVALGLVLIVWWMSQGYDKNPWFKDGVWNVFSVYSNASIVTQWALVILVGIILNRWLYKRFCK